MQYYDIAYYDVALKISMILDIEKSWQYLHIFYNKKATISSLIIHIHIFLHKFVKNLQIQSFFSANSKILLTQNLILIQYLLLHFSYGIIDYLMLCFAILSLKISVMIFCNSSRSFSGSSPFLFAIA